MKNRDIKKCFYNLHVSNATYVPTIFIDEIWDYLMSTVGEYTGIKEKWAYFKEFIKTYYNGNIDSLYSDLNKISDELHNLFINRLDKFSVITKEDYLLYGKTSLRPNHLEDAKYLTLDLRSACFQVFKRNGIITDDDINEAYNKCTNGEVLRKEKWSYIYFLRKINLRPQCYLLCKKTIIEALNCNDPFLKNFQRPDNLYLIIGDKIYIKITEEDEIKYKDYLYKDYTSINSVSFYVDICDKKTIFCENFQDIHVITYKGNSTNSFFANVFPSDVSHDLYPQIYKKIKNLPIERYDLVYGYDDDINYFKETIW